MEIVRVRGAVVEAACVSTEPCEDRLTRAAVDTLKPFPKAGGVLCAVSTFLAMPRTMKRVHRQVAKLPKLLILHDLLRALALNRAM